MAVDVREPELKGAHALRKAYEAKARAELAEADSILGAAKGSWRGEVVGARVAFVFGTADAARDGRVSEAIAKAAAAFGAGAEVFDIVARPTGKGTARDASRRLRLAIEAVDPLAVMALDAPAAQVLASAFGLDALPACAPVVAFGRAVAYVGDFAASLDDPKAKARVWSAMKATASSAGLEAKRRPKAPPESVVTTGDAGDRD